LGGTREGGNWKEILGEGHRGGNGKGGTLPNKKLPLHHW